MKFNKHYSTAGMHAPLSPSNPYWVNYDEARLDEWLITRKAAERGTRLHEFAAEAIELGIRLPDNEQTLNMYVNDAIGYRMVPEQMLFYSVNCFGTADAIQLTGNTLRIHDLKTGVKTANEIQLYIYAALFCLEYKYKPVELNYELRIYQNGEVRLYEPTHDEIAHIMDRIVTQDRLIEEFNSEN